jgi:hypothetical protein
LYSFAEIFSQLNISVALNLCFTLFRLLILEGLEFFLLLLFCVLGLELRPYQSFFVMGFLGLKELFAQAGFELQSSAS